MRNKNTLSITFLICLCLGHWFHCKSNTTDNEIIKQKEMENYLKTAQITSIEKDEVAGRTAPWNITLYDGKVTHRARFKHLNRSRPSLIPDSYKYEIAAYELDKLLGLNVVPPVVEREIEGIAGSLQIFIEGCITENERKRRGMDPPDSKKFKNDLEVINVFENLVLDEDCFDEQDTLIHIEDWKVCRVDFSMAFSPVENLIAGCQITRCSKKLYQNLLNLDNEVARMKLGPYLNEDEIQALLNRKEIIIENINRLIQEKGKDSVLFQ